MYALYAKYGNNHPMTLTLFANLAFAELKSGHKDGALKTASTAYEISLKLLGEKHMITVNAATILAVVKSALGKHKEALEHISLARSNALQLWEKTHYYTKKVTKRYAQIRFKAFLHGVR